MGEPSPGSRRIIIDIARRPNSRRLASSALSLDATDKIADIFREIAGAPAAVSVAEQHVEDVVALLATGFGGRLSGEGGALGWRDAIPVDHPGTLLDAAGDQVLCLSRRGRMAIHNVAAGEAWRAEEAETQCQDGGDQGLRHSRFPHLVSDC